MGQTTSENGPDNEQEWVRQRARMGQATSENGPDNEQEIEEKRRQRNKKRNERIASSANKPSQCIGQCYILCCLRPTEGLLLLLLLLSSPLLESFGLYAAERPFELSKGDGHSIQDATVSLSLSLSLSLYPTFCLGDSLAVSIFFFLTEVLPFAFTFFLNLAPFTLSFPLDLLFVIFPFCKEKEWVRLG